MTPVERWLARRERNRQIRAEMAAARSIAKELRHQQRLAKVDGRPMSMPNPLRATESHEIGSPVQRPTPTTKE